MKTALSITLTLFFSISFFGQDTLFSENFDAWNYVEIDSIFENYDEDEILDYNGLSQRWFVGNFGNGGSDSSEIVALSSSWLNGYQDGNRNHLRLPGFYLSDASTTLSWKSAPALGNLYMDGYTVLISTDPDFYYYVESADCDTLMHFAQNENNVETSFSEGILHDSFDTTAGVSPTGVMQYPGKLKPWSVSLAAYAGQTVYISFLHNSDDDNFIALDDILLLGAGSPAGVATLEESMVNIYPNPVRDFLNVDLSDLNDLVSINIYNTVGQQVFLSNQLNSSIKNIDVSSFIPGMYFLNVLTNNGRVTTKFIKK